MQRTSVATRRTISTPSLTPGPQLRRDVQYDGHAQPAKPGCQTKVEVGRVNQDRQLRLTGGRLGLEPSHQSVDPGQLPNNLGKTHMGELLAAGNGIQAGCNQPVATNSERLEIRTEGLQGAQQISCVDVARNLAGHDQEAVGHACDCAGLRRPVRPRFRITGTGTSTIRAPVRRPP